MTIALVVGTYRPNSCGVAHYTARLREKLASAGVRTIILTDQEAAAASNDPTVCGVVSGWEWTDMVALTKAVHRTNADLLHVQHAAGTYGFRRGPFLLPPLLHLTGWSAPIVTTVHEYGWWDWSLPDPLNIVMERLKEWGQNHHWWDREDGFLLTGSDEVIVTNPSIEHIVRERLPGLNERLHHIPIGTNISCVSTDRDAVRSAIRSRYDWNDDTLIIVFFGFLHPVKGLETLLQAFRTVIDAEPGARLLLAGGVESLALRGQEADRYRRELQERIASLNLEQKVVMTGYLAEDDVSRHLSAADLGVLPFKDGVTLKSGSLLTLMVHEVPPIITRHDPPVEALSANAVARQVSPGDREALASAIVDLVRDESTRTQLGTAGKQFAKRFSWSRIASQHLEIYRRLRQEA